MFEYPALLIFHDSSIQLVRGVEDLHSNYEWSVANYHDSDLLIDINLKTKRFSRCDEHDEAWFHLSNDNTIYTQCSADQLKAVLEKLSSGSKRLAPDSAEVRLAQEIIRKIRDQLAS